MNTSLRLSVFLLFIVLLSACNGKKKSPETSDLLSYSEYISYSHSGVQSVTKPIEIVLAQPLEQFDINQEIPADIISSSPSVKGRLLLKDSRTLIFEPSEKLNPDTEYTFKIKLSELFEDIPKDLSVYTFSFKTIPPNFKVNINALQTYDKNWQYIEGNLESADLIEADYLSNLIKADQNGKALKIKWEDPESGYLYYKFTIDSIQRFEDDSQIHIEWDGKAIASNTKGENDYSIPGYNNFSVVEVKTQPAPKASLIINFSNTLDPKQDFSGLVIIDKLNDLNYEVNGNLLYVYPPTRVSGDLNIRITTGIKDIDGLKMRKEYSGIIAFEQLKPAVELISKGVIMPNSDSTPLYFKAVNLNAIDVRIIKVYEDNMLQFLQDSDLNQLSSYSLRKVGRLVAKKTVKLDISPSERGLWKAHGLNLSGFFKADPGALYQVELSFKNTYSTYECAENVLIPEEDDEDEYYYYEESYAEVSDEDAERREEQYWNNETYSLRREIYDWRNRENPCFPVYYQSHNFATTNLLGSDLGLIAKKGTKDNYHFFTNNIITAKPESGVTLRLYDYQQQLIISLVTDNEGKTEYDSDKPIAFVIAQKKSDYAYAKLGNNNALSLSKFDISGKTLQKGLKGFMYAERGVHRPGDSIHLTFVLNDKENPLPKKVPVKLEVKDPHGKLVHQTVLSEGTSSSMGKSEERFYYFPITTKDSDPTGNWWVNINVGGASFDHILRIATVKPNRLKIKLDFDDEILSANKPVTGEITGSWLHGAPARNLKVEMDVTFSNAGNVFENFKQYQFTDPVRSFSTFENSFLKAQLSPDGKFRFNNKLEIGTSAPGMLKATFLTKLFEGGGDFSTDVFSKNLAPFTHFVGLKTPEPHRYGSFYTDENNRFEVVSVDAQGKISGNRDLRVLVYKIQWRWWWNRGSDRLSSYENAAYHKPFKDYEIKTNAQGKAEFTLNIPDEDRGRYLIRVLDKVSGHAAGQTSYFYKNWYESPGDGSSENAEMLIFSAEKDKYQTGETAQINFPSSEGGYALVSVENGSSVLSTQWVQTQKAQTRVDIPLTSEMAPNVFVNISLLQPHERTKNDLPVRLFGVIPLKVEDSNTLLKPQITMPESLKPNEAYSVKISEENKRGMTYTLAVVDEGLLDLTRFRTPDIHGSFNSHQALGVKTFDIYDYVIGAFSGSVNNIYEIGGDDAAPKKNEQKANRFIPVVSFLGPYYLPPGQTKTHNIQMPNYIGSVRAMVVAGNAEQSAYGNAEKAVPVKKPLMVLASLPRKLSPGEKVTLPVTVFAMEDKIKNVQVSVKTSDALKAVNGNSKTLSFNGPDEKVINFEFDVLPTNKVQNLTVEVSGNGEKASYEVEFDVFNPNTYSHKITNYELAQNESKAISYEPYGVEGSNSVKLQVSTLPPMDLTNRIQYLMNYPHGCIEQTSSSAFPLLFLDEIMDMTTTRKQEIDAKIKKAIQRVGDAQLVDGALPFWPGENRANSWVTSYAGHFMLEAKEKGYALPISFLSNWLAYQKSQVRSWSSRRYAYNSTSDQAYRLYTLALAGQPELAAMNRLRESADMSNDAKWRLAAAYALAGKKDVAEQIIRTANINFSKNNYYYYGSAFRNQAMALETMVLTDDARQREISESLAKKLSTGRWMSTQETAFGLLSIAKMVRKQGGRELDFTLTQNGKTTTVKTNHSLSEQVLIADMNSNSLEIKNNQGNVLYVDLYQEGKLPVGSETAEASKLTSSLRFVDGEGKNIDVSKLRQGTEITAHISVYNDSDTQISNLALTQIFPSGWEIVNTSYTELGGGAGGPADFTDIRDDRVYFYLGLASKESKTFTVRLNTSYLGKYYMPGTYVEAMYDSSYYVQKKGQWVEVEL